MFIILKLLLGFCLVRASYARSEAEIREEFLSIAVECNKEIPITAEEMDLLRQHKVPDTENPKCLLACVFRKSNWMDGKGMLDTAAVSAMMDKEHIDDPDKREKSSKLFDECKKVNDESVSDGDKGCERAALLTKCLTENAPKMGLGVIV